LYIIIFKRVFRICIIICRKEEEMEKMRVVAAKAMNISLEAYNITRDAVNQQKNIRFASLVFNHFYSVGHLHYTYFAYLNVPILLINFNVLTVKN